MNLTDLRQQYEGGAITKQQLIHQTYSSHRQLFEYISFLHGTNVRAIEITDEGVTLALRNPPVRMWCPLGDERHAAVETMNLRSYEGPEFAMVARLFEGSKTFFDIGANAGYYSLGIASRFPDATIFSFEPIPASYEQIRRNAVLNGFSNITPHPFGFSVRAGSLTLYYDPTVTGATSGARPEPGTSVEEVVCRMETLDGFVAASGCEPDLIKCDVEGAELFVFLGGRQLLERRRPVVFTEMLRKWARRFDYHPNDIICLFAGLGYRCYRIVDNELHLLSEMTGDTVETNFFFLHEREHVGLLNQVAARTH